MEHGRLLSARAQSPLPAFVLVLVLACCLIASSRLALSQHLSKRSISAAHALWQSRFWFPGAFGGGRGRRVGCQRTRHAGVSDAAACILHVPGACKAPAAFSQAAAPATGCTCCSYERACAHARARTSCSRIFPPSSRAPSARCTLVSRTRAACSAARTRPPTPDAAACQREEAERVRARAGVAGAPRSRGGARLGPRAGGRPGARARAPPRRHAPLVS